VRGRGGDDRQVLLVGQQRQGVVAVVGQRVEFVAEFDGHVVAAESGHQLVEGPASRVEGEATPAAGLEGLPEMALAAAGEHQPASVGGGAHLVEVVDRPALGAAPQLGDADGAGEVGVALRVAGQGQQVGTGWVRDADAGGDHRLGLSGGQRHVQPELGPEAGGQPERLGRLGEADDAVHAVVVGEGEAGQAETGGLLGQFVRSGRTVEEAEGRVRVQFGVRDGRGDARQIQRDVFVALTRPRR
jgi:hypothetical protein